MSKSIICNSYLSTINVSLLLSKSDPLIIDDKINRERDTFKLNMDIRGSIDWQEFKGVYNNVMKVDI